MPVSTTVSTASRHRHAVLVARPLIDEPEHDVDASLHELEQLLAGLEVRVVERVVQRRSGVLPPAVLGAGKLEELRERLAAEAEAPSDARGEDQPEHVLVFDGALTPAQQRVLQQSLGCEVTDRTGVILRVFEQRAQTDIARAEVELAKLDYEAPRVRDDRSLVGREGGGGGRGERGHTNVELRKQLLRERKIKLLRELERLRSMQATQRERRESLPRVALVGYTNAGKSSLMRALTDSTVHVEDQLFATLGTTVRALSPQTNPRILVSDTVGFIRNLPHALLASFRSTLEEVREADLLLHVVDAADPDWRTHVEVTRATLDELGASEIPALLLLNKIDRLEPEALGRIQSAAPDAIVLSAHDARDVERLHQRIVSFFDGLACEESLLVPIGEARLLAEVQARARVLEEAYTHTHARLRVRARANDLARWCAELRSDSRIESTDDLLTLAMLHELDLESETTDFDTTGLDFLVVHARDEEGVAWVVRTPRRPEVAITARTEARVLRLVQKHLPVDVPMWRVHAHDIIAYPRIMGRPMVRVEKSGDVHWAIDPAAPSEALLDSLAKTLAALQAIPHDEVRRAGVPVVPRNEARAELTQAMLRTRDLLEPSERMWARWQRWLDDDRAWPSELALVHGDFHPGHLIIDERDSLVGVLDWTEAKLTDPTVDFAVIHGCFGFDVATDLVHRFERAGGRTWPGFVEHAACRWAISPVLAADWALRMGHDGVMSHARAQLQTLEQTETP